MAKLFEPINLGGVELHNRVMISPMCQYSAEGGVANEWHRAQYGRFAMGGAGLVMVEATSVNAEGMGTLGDLGLWTDEQEAALTEIARAISALGAVPGIQLGHSGRKAAAQRPWHGNAPLGPQDAEERNELPWPVVAPSAVAMAEGWQVPQALDAAGIEALKADYAAATRRALRAGYKVVELHCAHGYLMHEFLSPLSNLREDEYGGSRESRMRLTEGGDQRESHLGLDGLRALEELLASHFELKAHIGISLADDAMTIERLTAEQAWILDSLADNKEMAISGGAGSGKTVLAVEKAIRSAAEGRRTLLTCYNAPLSTSTGAASSRTAA